MSNIRIGDGMFVRSGIPGVVRERDPIKGALKLDINLDAVQVDMRHGYLNGLPEQDRETLYGILDEAKGESLEPQARVDALQTQLEELEKDPRNFMLARYVKAEMTHIMNTFNLRPRLYSVLESKVR